ncbi:MAG TPA: purine-nucleoside phosphorylase [Lachnospiraceae bacterium]|nr:purine-nucleoside phosphorylase [Lachnospiraceae bacterium]
MELMKRLEQAAEYIKTRTKYSPKIGVILGSGLGDFGDSLENAEYYDYKDVPNLPVSTVIGHKGRFVVTSELICMQGRFHFYEGYNLTEVTFPIRLMKLLGVEKLIVTNAAGGVNTNFSTGDLMVITDHINMMGTNPLIGANLDAFGTRFPDMSNGYDKEMIDIAMKTGEIKGLNLKRGVYCAMTGPSFETPAEIQMVRIIGGDAVGMSTVPEVITANHCGIKVLGISCITNMAAGVNSQPLNHAEVIETTKRVKEKFIDLVRTIIKEI